MDDLISRQAAIDAVHNEFDDCIVWDESGMTTANEVERILDSVPSAQPEPCGEVVSREVLVKFFDDWMSALDINCHHQSVADLMIIKGDIKNLPSAQPKIVRCKDCKWKQGSECVRFAEVRPFPDDFCSRAERRTE